MPSTRVKSEGTLSVCMIVKNEADFLARCLSSVRLVADEIVVVDTGSHDNTAEVAASFGARVVNAPWRNDFSYARNISLDHATCAWILWLDADDVVPAQSVQMLRRLKKEKPDRVFGFIVRNQRPSDTGTEFIQARMFPNRPEIRFERRVHEQMMPSALRIGLAMERQAVVIEHHGYADPATLKTKAKRNIGLMLEEYDPRTPDPVTAVEIADSYQLIDEYDDAVQWYGRVLAVSGISHDVPAIASQAYTGLGTICNKLERYDEAVRHLREAVTLAPWRTDAMYVLAVTYDLKGEFEEAIECLRSILETKPEPGQVGVDFRAAAIKAVLRLLRILVERGRTEEATREAAAAVHVFPDRPETALMAGKVFLAANDLMAALRQFEKSITLAGAEPHIDSYIGLCAVYQKANRMDTARVSINSLTSVFGKTVRYRAFVRFFFGDAVEGPELYAMEELEKEWRLIQRDFFNAF
ncbi:MAG: glycosyltransferase [Chitinispirillaceae bacterium]|nr:glycosyltransferase [Chitinispirillaceae bacterium]